MPLHRSKKSHFLQMLEAGMDPAAAARKAKIRHRQTAHRYRQVWLLCKELDRQEAAKQAQREAVEARKAALKAQAAAAEAKEAQAARQAEQEARRALEVRCTRCGSPQPPHGIGCHCYRPEAPPVLPHMVDWSKVKPDYGADFRAQELQRSQAALDASVSDPFNRPLKDEHRLLADQLWNDWKEERLEGVRRQLREEERQAQKERDRQTWLLTLPGRGHRL